LPAFFFKLLNFASESRLGVNSPGGDIDTLCLCCRHIERDDFFGELFQLLQALPEVKDITVSFLTNFKTILYHIIFTYDASPIDWINWIHFFFSLFRMRSFRL